MTISSSQPLRTSWICFFTAEYDTSPASAPSTSATSSGDFPFHMADLPFGGKTRGPGER